jgi:hypothetical protein
MDERQGRRRVSDELVTCRVLPLGDGKISTGEHIGGVGDLHYERGETFTVARVDRGALERRGLRRDPMSAFVPLFTSPGGVRHDMAVDGDKLVFRSVQDTDNIIEANKAMATHNDGYTPSRDFRRAASIPMNILYKWKNEEGWDPFRLDIPENARKMMQKLNSNEWSYLRTAPGCLGVSGGRLR